MFILLILSSAIPVQAVERTELEGRGFALVPRDLSGDGPPGPGLDSGPAAEVAAQGLFSRLT